MLFRSDRDTRVANLSAGGSLVAEWYYLVRRALDRPNSLKTVIAGFADPCSRLSSNSWVNSYLPFLMSWSDVIRDWKNGYISTPAAKRLAFLTALPVLHVKDEIMARVISEASSQLRPAMDEVLRAEGVKAALRLPSSGAEVHDPYLDLKRFISLVRGRGLRLVFVQNPISSSERTPATETCVRDFLRLCHSFEVECANLSQALPDEMFEKDGVHVRHDEIPSFRKLLDDVERGH